MKKNILKVIYIIAIIMILVLNLKVVYAADYSEIYNPITHYSSGGSIRFFNKAMTIAGYVRYGALIAAVGMLMFQGIKFVVAAPEGKADAKKQLMPWAIGVIILFSLNIVIEAIVDFSLKYLGG